MVAFATNAKNFYFAESERRLIRNLTVIIESICLLVLI